MSLERLGFLVFGFIGPGLFEVTIEVGWTCVRVMIEDGLQFFGGACSIAVERIHRKRLLFIAVIG